MNLFKKFQKPPVPQADRYRVTLSGGIAFAGPSDGLYAAGERVLLCYPIIMDAELLVTVDGRPLDATGAEAGYICYEFSMPAHDVTAELELRR